MANVIRTRMYVTVINLWLEVGRVHALFFKGIKPATTLIEVSWLIEQKLLVKMEVTAVCES